MKILFVSASTSAGGAEKVLYELAAALSKNHEVRVLSLFPSGYYAQKLEAAGVKVKSLNVKKIPRVKDFINLKREIASFGPDIVHAFLYRAIQMCRILKNDSFKLFTTPHTNYQNFNKFLRLVDAALKSKDTLSLAESNSTKEFLLINQRYDKNKVVLTENSVSGKFKKNNAPKTGNDFVILCAARLEEVKGHKHLLDAFSKIYNKNSNAVLWLAGDGTEKTSLDLYALGLGVKDRVKFLGFQEDMPALYNAADIFVLPSLSESLPLAAVEAAACGLPLILTNAGDNSMVCVHGKNGWLVPPGDDTALACFIREMIDNKKLRGEFAAKSPDIAKKFRADSAAKHLEIYSRG